MKIVEEFSKIHQTFFNKMLCSKDRQRKGRTLWFEKYNFDIPLETR